MLCLQLKKLLQVRDKVKQVVIMIYENYFLQEFMTMKVLFFHLKKKVFLLNLTVIKNFFQTFIITIFVNILII